MKCITKGCPGTLQYVQEVMEVHTIAGIDEDTESVELGELVETHMNDAFIPYIECIKCAHKWHDVAEFIEERNKQ